VTEIQSLSDKISAILARNDLKQITPPLVPETKPTPPVIDLTSDVWCFHPLAAEHVACDKVQVCVFCGGFVQEPAKPKAAPPPPPRRPPPQEESALDSARPTLESTKSARMYKGVSSLAKKWQKVQRKSVFAASGRVMEMSSFMAKWEVQRAVTVLRQPGSWFAGRALPLVLHHRSC
jgi:hypothetical protein